MDLSRIIIGQVMTEKAERQKAVRSVTLRVDPAATKVDVKNALKRYFDVEATSVRVQRVGGKSRELGAGRQMQKRAPYKKMTVTLHPKSKQLDLAQFKVS